MTYEKLSKLFYKLDTNEFEKEISKRTTCYGTFTTDLTIKGFRKGHVTDDHFDLFYVNIPELMHLNNEVLLNSKKIAELVNSLPEFVVDPYYKKLIINEAQSNNEIEGVRSTKKELREALKAIEKDEPKNKKFVGLMKTYLHIDTIKPFEDVSEFRSLYDSLVADEIADENNPDGELFRTDYVEINNGTSVTHIGVKGEENIIHDLNKLINYLGNDAHPALYKFMVAHYYYEYIHPFYDGNGRTGRLLVGSYLARYLEKYSAITFSYAVNKNKSKYYKALEEIPSPLNKGEVTFYLINMLELLTEGQNGIIEDLELNLMKLQKIQGKIVPEDDEGKLLYILTTIQVFVDEDRKVSTSELMEASKLSRHKVDKAMKAMVEKEYVEIVSKNPKSYAVTEAYLEKILPM